METINLSIQNAHRVLMVRLKNSPENQPMPFHFRGKVLGYCNYLHLIGKKEDENMLRVADFSNWEVTEVAHPGYLEEYWNLATRAYFATSMSSQERGENDISSYEKELHEDLTNMSDEQRTTYIESYKRYFSAMLSSQSNCMSSMVTGPAGFNPSRNEKANRSNQNRINEFREWRERALKAIKRQQQASKPEEKKQSEAWIALRKDIGSSAATINAIHTGEERGYNKALFVSSIYNKVGTFAKHGEVEIVDKAIAFIRELNGKLEKPVITEKHKFFQLPDVARKANQSAEETANRDNKEVAFEGGTLVFNYQEDRLQIIFDKKPNEEIRDALHREYSFNWSPRFAAWQRILTPNAIRAAKRFLNLDNLELE